MTPSQYDQAADHTRPSGSSDVLTVIAIAIVAYAACDMTHEGLGHGIAAALSPDVDALSLSTVALQTNHSSRFVAAAGSLANIIVGAATLWYVSLKREFSNGRFFLWLFATLNLFNGTGYLLFTGLVLFGDWAVVIAGLQRVWMWRMILFIVGLATYFAAIFFAARVLASFITRAPLSKNTVPRLVLPAYIAGGVIFVLAACLNPIGVNLIWLSGVSSGFGAMFGLLLITPAVERRAIVGDVDTRWVEPSRPWQIAGLIVGLLFIVILGRGVQLK